MAVIKKEALQRLLRQDRVKFIEIKETSYRVNDYNKGYVDLTRNGYKRSEDDIMDYTLKISKFVDDITGLSYTKLK